MFPLVSHVPSSPPFSSPSLFACAAFICSEHCCGTGVPPRNKAEFSILVPVILPLLSPPALHSCPPFPSFFPHPHFSPPTIHPSLPHAAVSALPDGCSCSMWNSKMPSPQALQSQSTLSAKTEERKNASACSVSHLEKSHSNAVWLENPNWSTVHNYFPSLTPIFFLSLTPSLSPASHLLFFLA